MKKEIQMFYDMILEQKVINNKESFVQAVEKLICRWIEGDYSEEERNFMAYFSQLMMPLFSYEGFVYRGIDNSWDNIKPRKIASFTTNLDIAEGFATNRNTEGYLFSSRIRCFDFSNFLDYYTKRSSESVEVLILHLAYKDEEEKLAIFDKNRFEVRKVFLK